MIGQEFVKNTNSKIIVLDVMPEPSPRGTQTQLRDVPQRAWQPDLTILN